MTLEQYREAWQEHEGREVPPPDDDLVAWVARRAEEFEKRIRRRDLVETVAAGAVVVFFGREVATAASLLAKAGAAVVVAGACLVVWRLRRARAELEADGAGRPVAERLRVQRRKVEAQIELLESVLWWYVAPPALGGALFVYGVSGASWSTALALAVVAGISAFVLWLNRRAVRRDLRPRREELNRRLRRLEEP
jgi:membrane protein implicated in regulation of membrane protease activity